MLAIDIFTCRNDRERAAWLLAVPFAVLVTEAGAIRAALLEARFLAGLAYLENEILFLSRPRNPAANYEPMSIRAARGDMRRIAFGAAPKPTQTRGESVDYG